MKSLFLLVFFLAVSANAAPTKVFHNGNIHVLDDKGTVVEWIAVENGKVAALGKGELPAGEKIDLKGKVLLPGLTDAHAHIIGLGESLSQLDLRGMKSPEAAADAVKAYAKTHPTGTLVGQSWDQSEWPGQKFPERGLLDKAVSDRPVILYRVDGHAAWVNTAALKKSGLWETKQNPQGGKILRDAKGEPNGILVDTAMSKLSSLTNSPSDEQLEAYVQLAVQNALENGITEVHDAGISARELAAVERLLANGKVKFRFYEMLSASETALLKKGTREGEYNDQLTVRAVKLYQDGAMGSRGAAFHDAYHDDPGNHGLERMSLKEMTAKVKEIDEAGFQVAVHAIGSKANQTVIDAVEKVMGKNTAKRRPRLEHAQVLTARDIERAGKLGIIASMQPTHCTSDMKWVVKRIGEKRAKYSYAWKSLLKAKAPLAFGSDAPVESINPWEGLFSAITRQDSHFHPSTGFFPEQRLTVGEAMHAFTRGAAFAGFTEDRAGTLEVGRRADFVVLPGDPFSATPNALRVMKPEATYVGGEKVFERAGGA